MGRTQLFGLANIPLQRPAPCWRYHEAGAELAWAEVGVRTTPSGSWGGLWQPQDGGTLLGGGDWPRKADPEGAVRGSGRGSVRVGSGAGLRVLGATAGQDLGRRQVVLGALHPSSALPGQTSQGSAETPPPTGFQMPRGTGRQPLSQDRSSPRARAGLSPESRGQAHRHHSPTHPPDALGPAGAGRAAVAAHGDWPPQGTSWVLAQGTATPREGNATWVTVLPGSPLLPSGLGLLTWPWAPHLALPPPHLLPPLTWPSALPGPSAPAPSAAAAPGPAPAAASPRWFPLAASGAPPL